MNNADSMTGNEKENNLKDNNNSNKIESEKDNTGNILDKLFCKTKTKPYTHSHHLRHYDCLKFYRG